MTSLPSSDPVLTSSRESTCFTTYLLCAPSIDPLQGQNERLPPEILAIVFDHVFRLHIAYKFIRKAYNGEYREISWISLVSLTGVCRFWREVALSKPEWWTCLPTHNISAMELFLKRSQSLPLTYVVNTGLAGRPLPLTRGRQQMLLSKEMMPRLKRLYWTFDTRDDKLQAPEPNLTPSTLPPARVHKLLGAFPAPQLEELCLDGPGIHYGEAREEDCISAKIFTGQKPPKLHTLSVTILSCDRVRGTVQFSALSDRFSHAPFVLVFVLILML